MTKLKSAFLAVPVCALVGWVGYSFYQAYQPQPERFQGQIEAQQYSVSSKVPGRIEDVLVRKGQQVNKGDLIFTLYTPELDAKLEQAKAGQQAADAMAEQAERGARSQEINAARDQWQKARAAAQLAEKTFNRVDALYVEGVTAEQKRDEAYTQWQAAQYTENAAHQMYEMAKAGARTETKRAAQEKARMAAGAVAEVEAYTKDTKIHSWYQGEVSQILLHSGELAPQGFPVVTVIDMNDAWAVFNVREDKLRQFQQGTEFNAKIPALGEQAYRFKVSHVAPMGDFATWRATNNQKGYDMRTFEVEARPIAPIQGLRAGMSVLVSDANVQG
ncbi:efflux RND transporter periplasmic adaptor subunit [Enterovibrio sp. ZSDZ35]|uniref:Efflux RND transporter periplasmic adaptor subunit n=1 Tax=Enterovibrio qingdaonensis TaxID=2899818 RepID=A0ABT5QG50_9GAMM|nr:efflux RND transporter periplasmic adaptor subunit [Enterovibrio sp. ZSDZ35]MDD1779946.1 efflux RND transporter periplasmic adaptor subunit [Enterovibrio sp. ZSDZ35]